MSLAIEIVSASAGSGKTHRLVEELLEAIEQGAVRPEAVVLTTFTRKAAVELERRVRTRLLERGRHDEARRLEAARIGTVHAVCGGLAVDFAYDLGLSPGVRVLEPALAEEAFEQALAGAVSDPDRAALSALDERLSGFSGLEAAREVLDRARANGLDAAAVLAHGRRSSEEYRALLGSPAEDPDGLDRALAASLEAFLASDSVASDGTKTTAAASQRVRSALASLQARQGLPWSEWVALAKLKAAKRAAAPAAAVRRAAAAHDVHPRLHDDVHRAIGLVHSIASWALAAYQEHKRRLGAVDLADQEALALDLLRSEVARERLAGSIDLVLVDEFQDTSPIQLAIFLELARLARRSVWVGDPKQSIFGFREADPLLMDGALQALLREQEPETLRHSWRSTGPLLDLTNALFGPAFAAAGIPASRVTLSLPPDRPPPPDLGPAFEVWSLDARNKAEDAQALAAAARQLLGDAEARVRDPETTEVRPLRPGDVAILCRSNQACARIAAALERLGTPAVVARLGLLATAEGRVALRALQLFVDRGDSTAAAELARFLRADEDPDLWLADLVERPSAEDSSLPELAAVLACRERRPGAGALEALDLALEAVGLLELCRRWGDAPRRLRNLEQVRAMAVRYATRCGETGEGCTPAGLATWLARARDVHDPQAALADARAVTVSTWHAAKGLEWPVTVLFELDVVRDRSALGVSVAADRPHVDLTDPLAGRWIRCWPLPYHPANTGTPFHQRLADHPTQRDQASQSRREQLRLLYVAWTRARDRLVLAARAGRIEGGVLELLQVPGGPAGSAGSAGNAAPAGPRVEDGRLRWAGQDLPVIERIGTAEEPQPPDPLPGEAWVVPASPAPHPRARVRPSAVATSSPLAQVYDLGPRLPLAGKPSLDALGDAIHRFLAADRPGLRPADRIDLASGLLRRWGVPVALAPQALLDASDRLTRWVEARWPGAAWRREWPLAQRHPDGGEVHGVADLVLEGDEQLVVIDHKCFPGARADALERAAGHGGQLAAYAHALTAATGRPVQARLIHLPVLGLIAAVEPGA